MADTATPEHFPVAQGTGSAQGALADASNTSTKPPTLSIELASDFRASCVDQCAVLFRTCVALPGPVVPSPTPNIRSLSDVTLKVIGPCIEGQSVNLEALVKQICGDIVKDDDAIHVAVKNMVIQEANRRSYSHDKQSVKRESMLDSTRHDMLWRWEVKKVSCLGEHKPVALAMRSWLKQAQQCMATRLHAVKSLQKLTGANVTHKQQAAMEKAQQAVLPGPPPLPPPPPCDLDAVMLPKELQTPQVSVPEDTSKVSPAKSKAGKERKSDDSKEVVASRGFGSKTGLERSRGVMAMFIQKVPQPKVALLQKETSTVDKVDDVQQEIMQLQYIIDGLQDPGDVNVEAHWQNVLQKKWKPIGRKMAHSHVPGLPPAFARKVNSSRDPGQLAKLVLGHEHWKDVRTWRRKLLFFPADGNRPPFYGSFSRRSKAVSSRRILWKDADMDYEVLSDEEWEEEPEGEELDGSDGDDDAGMDEEEDTDGFMVADGYLSEDERAHDQGSDADVWDPAKAKAGLRSDVEPFLHSVVDQPTTSYLNVLLNAKNQGQPVMICRTAAGEGGKARSAELLQPLQMHLLEIHAAVVPAVASLDTTPMETITALADSAAAAANLQKVVGLFVDSLSDEEARQKSAIVDAVIEKFATPLPRSRIATVVLPAATAYCNSCKRWFSLSTMTTLASAMKESTIVAMQLSPPVNSAALQRLLGHGACPVRTITSAGTQNIAAAATPQHSIGTASLGTDKLMSSEDHAPVLPKKRRLQPVPVPENVVPSKQICPAAKNNSRDNTACVDDLARGDTQMTDIHPSSAEACALPITDAAGADQPMSTAVSSAQNSGTDTQAPTHLPGQPPQPGQGSMAQWMRDNPDRPRLPGGSDDVKSKDHLPLSPIASSTYNHQQQAPTDVFARQQWRRKKAQQPQQAANHSCKPLSNVLVKGAMNSATSIIEQDCGKENEGLSVKDAAPRDPLEHGCTSPFWRRLPDRSNLRMSIQAPDLSPPLHARSVVSHPIAAVDLTAEPHTDDNDKALQAALLASIGEDIQVVTPACGVSNRHLTDCVESGMHSDTSLAARTLQTLDLDPPHTGEDCCARSYPSLAGDINPSPPASDPLALTARANLTSRTYIKRDVPMERVTALRISDFTSYQKQKLGRMITHLQDCMTNTPENFSSWPALCTYLAIIPSFRDADTLEVAKSMIGVLEFLKPKWRSSAVFEMPRELLNVCVQACSIRRIEWLHHSALKCVIAIAMGVIRRSNDAGCDRVKAEVEPGCVNLRSLSCNECLLRVMVQAASELHNNRSFTQIMLGKQALMVIQEILQSAVGSCAAKHLASITCERTGRTALHELVLMKNVDEPKVTELVRGVLQQAFAKVHRHDQCDLLPPSRLLPAECTEWYMKQLLQDLSAGTTSRRREAVDILEALLQAPSCEARGVLGQNFVNVLASMSTRSAIMSNVSSKASVQFKSILRGIFLPQSTSICSKAAPHVFRLCCHLLSTDSCQEMQKLVIHAFRTPLKIPGERLGPSTQQVVKRAIEFYVGSCAENSVEERQQAAVIDSAWSALDQMLSRVFSAPGFRNKQVDSHTRPRPAALKSAGTEEGRGAFFPAQEQRTTNDA